MANWFSASGPEPASRRALLPRARGLDGQRAWIFEGRHEGTRNGGRRRRLFASSLSLRVFPSVAGPGRRPECAGVRPTSNVRTGPIAGSDKVRATDGGQPALPAKPTWFGPGLEPDRAQGRVLPAGGSSGAGRGLSRGRLRPACVPWTKSEMTERQFRAREISPLLVPIARHEGAGPPRRHPCFVEPSCLRSRFRGGVRRP